MTHLPKLGNVTEHECHWPGCTKVVRGANWGCTTHWFKLPWDLRAKIWNTFTPGQGATLAQYEEAERIVQEWIAKNG